ncbi:MAG: M50 family metallopeptidase [Candidatus Acidiferrales bacterium]
MTSIRKGAIHLFRFQGIDVYLHWSWFFVAVLEIVYRPLKYSSIYWNILEYLALFVIVTIHEFGHALACRQVGGTANQIVLWPLGGVAYVDPPPRPGAFLWSIAAGPLVNVALAPVLYALWRMSKTFGWPQSEPNLNLFLFAILWIDLVLLIFNMLPIYPLDGGQILQSLLWFGLGRARSLMAAAVVGFIGVAGLGFLALRSQSMWIGIIALYILMNCWNGLRQGLAMWRLEKSPRRVGYACPACRLSPPAGAHWLCGKCQEPFDTFESQGVCPHCQTQFSGTGCLNCHTMSALTQWGATIPAPPRSL